MLALDIGGANLKIADGRGYARSFHFALWKYPERLADQLRALIESAPQSRVLAVTMTGELADCFNTKSEGVSFIVDAARAAAANRRLLFYLTNGSLVSAEEAKADPRRAGASNWHALGCFAGRFLPPTNERGLLLDIGSTTTDIIPILRRAVCAQGGTDTERLRSGELVYTGVGRSPLCALLHQIVHEGICYPLCQELFATTRDAYLMLGAVPEDAADRNTADGRPATQKAARQRLGRMIAAWEDEFDASLALAMARATRQAQTGMISSGLRSVLTRNRQLSTAIIAGEGEFLARQVLEAVCPDCEIVSLSEQIGPVASRAAPAHALAVLAREANL